MDDFETEIFTSTFVHSMSRGNRPEFSELIRAARE